MTYKLSICIPTYNRSKYLKQLLDCIFNQLKSIEENIVEVCISNNCSTDNTDEVILEYQKKYNNITYFIQKENVGFDRNILNAVKISHGKYCWLFGDDDLISEDGIKNVLEKLKSNNDIYLCDITECDINMNKTYNSYVFKNNSKEKIFYFGTEKNIIDYFKEISTKSFNGYFTYLSIIVVKKEQWMSVNFSDDIIGCGYAHTYVMLSALKNYISLNYINKNLILYRGENDNLVKKSGIVQRMQLDFDGFRQIFTKVFKNSPKLSNYYKHILRKHYNYFVISGIYEKTSKNEKKHFEMIVKETHSILLIKVFSFFYYIYRKFIKNFLQKINIHNKIVKILFK